jgi:aldehyde:ferredoxin oxidoreductase
MMVSSWFLAGGRGLGVGLLERIGFKSGPLDPESPLTISIGCMIGISFPLANRMTIVFRSPLTGTVAWTQTGGYVGYKIASLGLSPIIISGSAEKYSYLQVYGRGISQVEVEYPRGLGAVETCSILKSRRGYARVFSIAPAGENLVKIATVVNDMGRSSGVRHGVGAILGSKNLKAIVFHGIRQLQRRPHDGPAFTQLP